MTDLTQLLLKWNAMIQRKEGTERQMLALAKNDAIGHEELANAYEGYKSGCVSYVVAKEELMRKYPNRPNEMPYPWNVRG